MLRDMMHMVSREEVWHTAIAFAVCSALAVTLFAVCRSAWLSWSCLILFGGIAVCVAVSLVQRALVRYRELCKGHCPNPLCHGVVQHSPHLPPTMVRCPTCGKAWPAPSHIDFKITSRQW